ncbi:MAG: sulfur carrier protein ThiS [Nitrospira sp.]|nr:sulfur carrier protein ThiS [Nitrospira sp.]
MVISVNGKSEEIQTSVLLDVLRVKQIEPQMVAVELNDVLIDRDRLDSTVLQDGDRVEFLFFMGGGL